MVWMQSDHKMCKIIMPQNVPTSMLCPSDCEERPNGSLYPGKCCANQTAKKGPMGHCTQGNAVPIRLRRKAQWVTVPTSMLCPSDCEERPNGSLYPGKCCANQTAKKGPMGHCTQGNAVPIRLRRKAQWVTVPTSMLCQSDCEERPNGSLHPQLCFVNL